MNCGILDPTAILFKKAVGRRPVAVECLHAPYQRRVSHRAHYRTNDVRETNAMPRFGIPNRERAGRIGQIAQVNWRRGLFRVWLLLSAAWIMGWTVYIVVIGIKDGFQSFGDLFAIPVLLIGPPVALFLFGVVARWAFRGFAPD